MTTEPEQKGRSPNGKTWLPNWLFDLIAGGGKKKIGVNGFAVYGILANHANAKGESWPGVQLIAKRTGLSERQVKREIRKLVGAKIIERNRVSLGYKCGTRNVYTLKIQGDNGVPMNNSRGHTESVQGDTESQFNGTGESLCYIRNEGLYRRTGKKDFFEKENWFLSLDEKNQEAVRRWWTYKSGRPEFYGEDSLQAAVERYPDDFPDRVEYSIAVGSKNLLKEWTRPDAAGAKPFELKLDF